MKNFVDKTESLREPAIKTGDFIPRDAVNLRMVFLKRN
jgi:hypothetical protein